MKQTQKKIEILSYHKQTNKHTQTNKKNNIKYLSTVENNAPAPSPPFSPYSSLTNTIQNE